MIHTIQTKLLVLTYFNNQKESAFCIIFKETVESLTIYLTRNAICSRLEAGLVRGRVVE